MRARPSWGTNKLGLRDYIANFEPRYPLFRSQSLDLIERDHVGRAVVELCGARAFVRCHGLGVLERAAGLQVSGDARGSEGMTADFGVEARVGRSTLLETHGRGMMLIGPYGDLAERVASSKFDRRKTPELGRDPAKSGPLRFQYSHLTVLTACCPRDARYTVAQ
jgi:hypothetical protein